MPRKAARVLPVPVGETMRAWLPARTTGVAAAWAGVGEGNACWNQRLTGDAKSNRGARGVGAGLGPV